MKWSKYNWIVPNKDHYILFNGFTSAIVRVDGGKIARQIQTSDGSIITTMCSDHVEILRQIGAIIEDDYDEILELRKGFNLWKTLPGRGINTIVVTTKCNFSCSYCYQNCKKPKTITSQVIDAYINSISRTRGSEYSIVLYGGEPLLALPQCEEILCKTRTALQQSARSMRASMISNGYLLDEATSISLSKCGLQKVQITIDGDKITHDAQRKHISGSCTYDTVIENAIVASTHFDVVIRCNVSYLQNPDLSQLRELCDQHCIRLMITPIVTEHYMCSDYYYNLQTTMNLRTDSENSYITNMNAQYPCVAVCRNELGGGVLLPDGDIVKCWDEVSTEGNRNVYGSIYDSISSKQQKQTFLDDWDRWNPYEDENCSVCKMLPTCAGGCPYRRVVSGYPKCSYPSSEHYERYIRSLFIVRGGEHANNYKESCCASTSS